MISICDLDWDIYEVEVVNQPFNNKSVNQPKHITYRAPKRRRSCPTTRNVLGHPLHNRRIVAHLNSHKDAFCVLPSSFFLGRLARPVFTRTRVPSFCVLRIEKQPWSRSPPRVCKNNVRVVFSFLIHKVWHKVFPASRKQCKYRQKAWVIEKY